MSVTPVTTIGRRPVQPVFDGAERRGGADLPELGRLPVWDLTGLYPEPAEAAITADFAWAEAEAKAFAADYKGRLAALDADGMLAMIARQEAFADRMARAATYVHLRFVEDMTDPDRAKAFGDMQARYAAISQPLVFLDLELSALAESRLDALFTDAPALERYRAWFDRIRAERPHQLSAELESYIHDKSVTGAAAWGRLFEQTLSALEFEVRLADETRTLALEPALTLMSDPDRATRAAAAAAVSATLTKNVQLFALITNTLAKDKEISDVWRKFPRPDSARHLSNDVEPEVVDALREAVQAAYPRVSHRYYALKARWLGVEKLEFWDRNAPPPDAENRPIPWSEARDVVLDAYGAFSPQMADIARRFFDDRWIHAPATPGKSPGAFAHPAATSAHPFVMLNYLGKPRDVMTLAHELGHGAHQALAADQGPILSRTPLTLAETASVFGEMLTFRRLLAAAETPARRRALLASKVEDMINTVVRQIAFYEFERRVHMERREGEITADRLGEIWLDVQTESLGPAFTFAPGYAQYWAYVPHFIRTPFYVYAYAFGDGLVNALYAVYEDACAGGDAAAFRENYVELLRAGGSKRHPELLRPFGLDARDPAFWQKGLSMMSAMIDELEALESSASAG